MPSSRRYSTPTASYRLQLHSEFGFAQVRELLPYLDKLGISHLYFSPIFTAAPGSTHGYDVFDHSQINPELGGLPALYELGEELLARDMGLILDMVPNHVGIAGGANPWWRDVLRYGRASKYASYFDIDWEAQPQMSAGVLVYPVLGEPFGEALESGELRLVLAENDLALQYYEHVLPLSPASYSAVIGLPQLGLTAQLQDPASVSEMVAIVETLRTAAPEQSELSLERFRAILGSEPVLAAFVEERLAELNGEVGVVESFDQLDALLATQPYRLAFWRVSGEEINYRRFFDINDLAAIRVEREEVFEATHRLLLDLVRRGIGTAVRIDHVDGLYNPEGYLRRLRTALDSASAGLTDSVIPIYVEKILAQGETLPTTWPVAGTSGYDFIADCDGLLVDREGAPDLTRAYERFLGGPVRVGDLVYRAKRQITDNSFAGEINVLAMQLHRIARRRRLHRDITLRALRRAIEAVLATFPIYRTYISEDGEGELGGEYIAEAVEDAHWREPELSSNALDFLAEVLLLTSEGLEPDEIAQRIHFRRRFQQLSGPVMAKGFEDTSLYRYNRLISLNEVGSDPASFGKPLQEVHRSLAARRDQWPGAMLAGSTHDTKRGEDVRARLHVLSEIPRTWDHEARRWARLNRRRRSELAGEPVPGPNTEYLIYQTLVGSWPLDPAEMSDYPERVSEYLTKALREMKARTSWTNVNERYEEECQNFLTDILDRSVSGRFLERLEAFVESLRLPAALNSLSGLVVRALSPGFPDIYQGSEMWNLSLTDPDNRRPVDYDLRRRVLDSLDDDPAAPEDLTDGCAKLWLTNRLLRLRAESPELVIEGEYTPLLVEGGRAEHVFAFARTSGDRSLVVAVPRHTAALIEDGRPPVGERWRGTRLRVPASSGPALQERLTGAELQPDGDVLDLADVFTRLPYAVLESV